MMNPWQNAPSNLSGITRMLPPTAPASSTSGMQPATGGFGQTAPQAPLGQQPNLTNSIFQNLQAQNPVQQQPPQQVGAAGAAGAVAGGMGSIF